MTAHTIAAAMNKLKQVLFRIILSDEHHFTTRIKDCKLLSCADNTHSEENTLERNFFFFCYYFSHFTMEMKSMKWRFVCSYDGIMVVVCRRWCLVKSENYDRHNGWTVFVLLWQVCVGINRIFVYVKNVLRWQYTSYTWAPLNALKFVCNLRKSQ